MQIQDGTYRAKAKSWALAASGKETPEVAVEFEFEVSEGGGKARLTWHGFLTDKAWERSIESLRYCGWTGDDLTDLTGLETNEVDIVIENEEYQGESHAKVRWVNRAGGLAVKARMSPEKSKSFAAMMKGKIRAFDAAKGTKPAPKPANGARPAGQDRAEAPIDDDLPF